MRIFFIILVISVLLISIEAVYAQNHFNNWYFGNKAGITFNTPTGEPVSLVDGVLNTLEGCSSISDNDGNLLFYTDGVTVWNKNHKMMENGDSLMGHYSSTQSAIIVPKPGFSNIYYIFTASPDTYITDVKERGIHYSVVDMSGNSGDGEVVEKNIFILNTRSEKLSAVINSNGKDIWVVSQDTEGSNFCSFLVTNEGVNLQPVKSPCTIFADQVQLGMIKFSINSKLMAVTQYDTLSCLLLYDFDNSNGIITNERILSLAKGGAYGLEFSRNSRFLYISTKDSIRIINKIVQVDISSGDINTMMSSLIQLNDGIMSFGSLQIAQNNKIYFRSNHYHLGVINNPNEKFPDCNINFEGVALKKGYAEYGLPSVVQGFNVNHLMICQGESIILKSGYITNTKIEWSGPLGYTSNEINPIIHGAQTNMSGHYHYKIRLKDSIIDFDSIMVTVRPLEKILFADTPEIIVNTKTYTLKAVEYPEKTKFKWYGIDSDENEVTITKGGRYSVVTENESGCRDSVSVFIKMFPRYCRGDEIFIDSQQEESNKPSIKTEYLWNGPNDFSSTERFPSLENVNESMNGDYFVRIITISGDGVFIGERDTIYLRVPVYVYGDLGLELSAGKLRLCDTDSTEIFPLDSYNYYLWSTGETTPIITVKDAGIYELIVKNEYGCTDTSKIEIFKYDANIEFDKENIIFDELCVGDFQIENLKISIKTETEFTISSITTTSNSFEIVNKNSLIKTYKNGDIVNIEIKFKPLDAGFYDDELVIISNEPCEFTKSIPISASAKQVLDFSFDEHFSIAGQSLEIPLLGQIKCPAPQNLITDYEIEVAFDKEYFSPESVKFGQIISNEIVGNERVIKIKADGEFMQTKSEINVIYGNALLGRSEVSPIIINDVKLSQNRYFPEYLNGSLNVDGCVNDITAIKMFSPTRMSISPNPSDGELKVSIVTQEQGSFSLVVFDIQGREVFRTAFSKSDKTFEQKDFNINTLQLGNGIYTIHLTAPWTMHREQVVVVR